MGWKGAGGIPMTPSTHLSQAPSDTRSGTNVDILRVAAMLGIILFHHLATKAPNTFVTLPGGFTPDSYYYDIVNNAAGHVQKLSIAMDFCYGHLGNGGNLTFMLVTGYFLFGRGSTFRKRVGSVVKVLLALLFHGILLTVINFAMLMVVRPRVASMPAPLFALPNWLSGENMWYLQAYGIHNDRPVLVSGLIQNSRIAVINTQ